MIRAIVTAAVVLSALPANAQSPAEMCAFMQRAYASCAREMLGVQQEIARKIAPDRARISDAYKLRELDRLWSGVIAQYDPEVKCRAHKDDMWRMGCPEWTEQPAPIPEPLPPAPTPREPVYKSGLPKPTGKVN